MSRTTVMIALTRAVTVLACLGAAAVATAADGPPGQLAVDYQPPLLSVKAVGQPLARVLSAIGEKVGFTVVENRVSAAPIDVSMENVSVDEALRQLLRGENHTVLYLSGNGATPAIDKIVLLGAPSPLTATAEPRDRAPVPGQPGPSQGDLPRPSVLPAPAGTAPGAPAPMTAESTPSASSDRGQVSDNPGQPTPSNVGDILRAHAVSAAQAAQAQQGQQIQTHHDATSAGPTAPAASIDAVLAETTRRAQQDLSTLVDGLAAATRSMQQSLPAGQK